VNGEDVELRMASDGTDVEAGCSWNPSAVVPESVAKMGKVCSGLVDVVILLLLTLVLVLVPVLLVGRLLEDDVTGLVVERSAATLPAARVDPTSSWYEPSGRAASCTRR
jgi:hypothetical protein